jgi:hypothetical protein
MPDVGSDRFNGVALKVTDGRWVHLHSPDEEKRVRSFETESTTVFDGFDEIIYFKGPKCILTLWFIGFERVWILDKLYTKPCGGSKLVEYPSGLLDLFGCEPTSVGTNGTGGY